MRRFTKFESYELLWISVLFGSAVGIWPSDPWLMVLILIFGFAFAKSRAVLILGLFVGLLRIQFSFWDVQVAKDAPTQVEAHIVKTQKRHSVADIQGQLFFLKPAIVGQTLVGNVQYKLFPTLETSFFGIKERSFFEQRILGQVKWTSPPIISDDPTWFESLRRRVERIFDTQYENLKYFRAGMFLGDGSGLPRQVWKSLNMLGLSHAIVISGSHLTVLASILILLFSVAMKIIPRSRVLIQRGFVNGGILLFAVICGFEISLMRAVLSFALATLISFRFPNLHRLENHKKIALVGIFLALIHPTDAFRPTYILSFVTTWGLVRLGTKLALETFFIPAIMVFSVAPLLSIVIHPLSPLCNLILLPILYFLIVPLSLISVFVSPLEQVADQAISRFYVIIETVARWLELVPSYSIPNPMVGALCLLAVSVLLIQRDMPVRIKILVSAVVVVFFYGAAHFAYQKQSIEGIRLSAIDIGQGDGFILGWGNSKVLVDGGSDASAWKKLAPTLVREGSRPLDLWVLTHFDRDHGGGFAEISRNVPFDTIWIPKFDRKKFPRTDSRALPFDENQKLSFCDGKYCLIPWMDPQQYGGNQSVTNDSSLVLLLVDRVTGTLMGVFLGDLEAKGEKKLIEYLRSSRWKIPIGGIRVLKVGHHGSRSSSTEALLALLRPEVAIVLCGRHNQYGHPHEEVIRRLRQYVGAVLRTDSIGDFEVSF